METESMNADLIEEWMVAKVVESLEIPAEEVDRSLPFTSLGLDSLTLLELTGDLAEFTGCEIPVAMVWEFPNINSLAEQLSLLSPAGSGITEPVVMRDRPFPLSYAQERIWRHACHDERGDTNAICEQWILRGALDVGVLNRSLDEVIRRHEILRTSFTVENGQLVQVIRPAKSVNIPVVDLSKDADPEATAVRLLREEDDGVFVLDGDILFRVRLFKLSEKEHRILFTLHHMLYDATSLEIFYSELSSIYAALSQGAESPLVEQPLQSADFAVWQREHLQADGAHYQKMLAWWKHHWSGSMPSRLKLPCRWRSKPKQVKAEESYLISSVPAELLAGIQALAVQTSATQFMLFYAAFEALLYQVSGQRDMMIGSYVSDRSRSAARQAIGYYINLIVLRTELSERPTFSEIVRQVREKLQQASIHQELPYEELVEAMKQEDRALTRLEVIFQQIPDLDECLTLAGMEVSRWRERSQIRMPSGLTMVIMEGAEGVKVRLRFDAGRYQPSKMGILMSQYTSVLERMVADPEGRVTPVRKRWFGIF
jgi:acyl carrier protein